VLSLAPLITMHTEIWKEVIKFKIDADLANNNEAVVKLIKKGLKSK
jgi:hypothetical protein